MLISGCGQEIVLENAYDTYEGIKLYGLASGEDNSTTNSFFAKNICVAGNEDLLSTNVTASLSEAAALFNLKDKTMTFGKNVHGQMYPASTTKILTAYVALKHGKLTDTATVTEENLQLETGSSICGLSVGDTTTLEELLYGLLLSSGNDAANVIADMISGNSEEFAKLMNEEAKALGATNSNFVNPHGLHDLNHYTTVYDMYLIFNAAIQNKQFETIINTSSHTGELTNASGQVVTKEWKNSNKYLNGEKTIPEGVEVVGGKTGTTSNAGSCLVLYSKKNNTPYISIVFKAENAENLYEEMTQLLGDI